MQTTKSPSRKYRLLPLMLAFIFASSLVWATSPSRAQDGSSTLTTEQALAEAVVPARDLSDLAVRLRGVTDIPPTPEAPLREYALGDVETFWVQNDATGALQIEASLIYINDWLYIWLEKGQAMDEAVVQQVADRFAANIYQPVRDVFGSEWSPGIDGDPRLHILHTAQLGPGIAGYYYSNSQYPRQALETSNQREMFFIDVSMPIYGADQYLSVLTHEFQHMIHWAQDSNEESWLNEGLAELATYITDFGVSGFASSYLNAPYTQLNYWPPSGRERLYGGGFLITLYLLERYGVEAIEALVDNQANGMDSIEVILAQFGAVDSEGNPLTVEQFYADWSLANYLNDTSIGDGRYGYLEPQMKGLPVARLDQSFADLPVSLQDIATEQWSTRYYGIRGGAEAQPLTLIFSGSEDVELFPIDAASGTYVMWSNRVNLGDARLTRAFDLREVDSATLTFKAWYDIEEEWDYAYVVVSTDGGQTWQIQPTDLTTLANTHGTSYGHGYTGRSDGWVEQNVDLSAYAGQEILVRFEYVTDDATLEAGFVLDDVAIPEIGYFQDFEESSDEWQSEGWVRLENNLRQHFTLHLVEKYADGSIQVRPLLAADEAPAGEWEVSLGGEIQEVTVVISPFAPITTEKATFDLQIQ